MFNLTNNIDVENTKLRMDQYQKENRDLIQRNKVKLVSILTHIIFSLLPTSEKSDCRIKFKLAWCEFSLLVKDVFLHHPCCPQSREHEDLEELLLQEQQGNEQRRLDLLQEEQRQLQAKRKNKQALLDELVRNTHDAHSCSRCSQVERKAVAS